jgi:hypothetical protein
VGGVDTDEEDGKISRRGFVVCRGRGPGVGTALDGKGGFHSSSCLEGRSVRFRFPLMGNFEAITIDLEQLSRCGLACRCSQARRLK